MKSNKVYIIIAIVCAITAIAAVAVLLLVLKDSPADNTVTPTPTAEVTAPVRTEKPTPPISEASVNHSPSPGNTSNSGFDPSKMTELELDGYINEILGQSSSTNSNTMSPDAEYYPVGSRGTACFMNGELILAEEFEVSLPSMEGCPLYEPWWDNCRGTYYYDDYEDGLGLYLVVLNDLDYDDHSLTLYYHEGKLIYFACGSSYTYDRFDADAAEMLYENAMQFCRDSFAAQRY